MEKIVRKGKVSELDMNNKTYLALEMPHKPEDATASFALENILSIQEIFKPYIGTSISIDIVKQNGKVRKITISEKDENDKSSS